MISPSAYAAGPADIPADLPTETFNGMTAPAGWNVINNAGPAGWRFDNPGGRTNDTGGAGNFAIADSDAAGNVPIDTELRTPELNLTGAPVVQLSFKTALVTAVGGTETADVDISVDGGANWTNVWRRGTGDGTLGRTFRGPVTLDLSAQMANQANVMVRFRFYTPSQVFYWELDDVTLLAPRAPATPTGLTATAAASQPVVALAWTRAGTNEAAFKIERSPDGATGWKQIGTTPGTVTKFADSDPTLVCNTPYFYRVRANNLAGDSQYSDPANATTLSCSSTVIEINQAIGQASGRYVAGKDTAILAYLPNPVTVNPATQTTVVQRNGTTLATLTPLASDQPTRVLSFVCPNRAACGDWQAGTYSFDVAIDGNVSNVSDVLFQDRRPLRILAVPVRASYGGTVKSVTVDDWKVAGDFIAKVYPVSPAGFNWQLGQEVDASQQDVLTDDGQRGLWQVLASLQPNECAANRAGPTCYDKIIGFLPERPGNLNGYTYGDPANIVAIQSGMRRTVAHEVGHNFGLGDEYDGLGGAFRCDANPTPPTYVGRDWFDRNNTNYSCVNSTTQGFDDSGTGVRVIAPQTHPYEIGGRGLLTTDLGDFMGNFSDVSKAWVSPDAWKQVFDQSIPVTATARAARLQTTSYRAIAAFGFIDKTGEVTLEPWYSFTTTETIDPISSTYTIAAVDGAGNTLVTQGLEVEFNVLDRAPVDEAPFDAALPFPANTVVFRIYKGTTLLKVVPVTPHAPTVSVTAPGAGQTVSGVFTITWQASDLDGGPLYATLEYNATGQADDWITLAADIAATQWMDDFTTLPGGTQARIRVTVSDGINASAATSAPFIVPAVAPEVFIDEGQPASSYPVGDEIPLSGSAFDAQDGWLTGDGQLVWSSNRDGVLGEGELLFVDNLSQGTHTITLTATNSLGLKASKSVKVSVVRLYQRFLPLIMRGR